MKELFFFLLSSSCVHLLTYLLTLSFPPCTTTYSTGRHTHESCYVEGLCTFASSAIRHFADLMLADLMLRRHVREGRGKGNAWLPVRLLVVAALGNLGNRMLHLLLPSQPQARGMERT